MGRDDPEGIRAPMTLRVVLAEDDPDIQLIARLALQRAQFDVTVAGNGALARARVRELRPDVVLLDWMMPAMDGLEVCSRLKADAATRDIPVVFLTAKSQESEIRRGLELGALGYIAKPFDPLTLGQQLREMLGR